MKQLQIVITHFLFGKCLYESQSLGKKQLECAFENFENIYINFKIHKKNFVRKSCTQMLDANTKESSVRTLTIENKLYSLAQHLFEQMIQQTFINHHNL